MRTKHKKEHRCLNWLYLTCLLIVAIPLSTQANSNTFKEPNVNKHLEAIAKRKITGTVKDKNGEPIIGASVIIKDTSIGTITDYDGNFSIEVPENGTVEISYIGFAPKKLKLTQEERYEISMEEDTKLLDEVIVVGYATQKKASLTGSISAIKVDDELQSLSASNMSSVLAGTMAGLRVSNTTGVPGVASKMQIRNAGSWNAASVVFVIDGVIGSKADFDRLDVNEVDNISVLKDAASAAIYGSRSTGGVVLITTRRGKEGKPQVKYNGSYAIQTRGIEMERTTGYETALLGNYMHRNNKDFWYYWDDEELEYMRNLNGGNGHDALKDSYVNPMSTHHSVTLSGGSERTKYFINGSYFKQTGFLEGLDYSRYSLRANLDTDITKDLKLFTQINTSFGSKNNITWGRSEDMNTLYNHIHCIQPDFKTTTSDGKPIDWAWVGNLKEFSNKANSGYNKDNSHLSEILLRLEYDIPKVKGLSAKAQFAYSQDNSSNKTFAKKQDLYIVEKKGSNGHIWTDNIIGTIKSSEPAKEYISQMHAKNESYQFNFQLNYNRTFGKHDLAALAVYEQREAWYSDFSGARENFPVLIKDQWFATSSARSDSYVGGGESESGRLSYITQMNYGYDDKYLLNMSMRVDGSMNFPKNKRYGYFPAASAAWVISKENFFKSKNIDLLKLRASVGLTGNDNVVGWQWQESYKYGSSAYLGTSPSTNPGIQFAGIVNPDITWEKSLSYNLGTDLYLADNWIFTLDAWYRHTYDILGQRTLSNPTSFGFEMPRENYGIVDSKGIDLEVTYRNNIRKFNYQVKGVFSYSTNKVKRQDYPEGAMDYDIPEGKTLGYIRGYRDDGIIRNQQQLDDLNNYYKSKFGDDHQYTIFGYKPELGMLVYKDISGPLGEADGKIDSYDRDVISKHSIPPFTAGLTLSGEWNGISVEALFQGDFGHKKRLDGRYLENMYEWNRMPRKWLDHWSEENPNGAFPEPKATGEFRSYAQTSTFTTRNASFVKMRYLNLGYKFPSRLMKPLGVSNLRLFFSATNLLTITGFDYWDPELANTGSYPNMKTFNFGLDITF